MSAIVVGAGIAGICAGVALRTAGIPFTVLEANAGLGGVWFENTYPGASVDTPSHLYSYSFAQRDWHRYFASQDEILGYLNDVADRFDVRSRIRFGTRVTSARYDESSRTWQVEATDAAGQAQVLSARILISSVGVFNPPKYPEVPGLGEYRGTLVHTARWPAGLDLSGQRVAVLGNGASAMQLVPAIPDRVAALTVYQRSPQWVAPFEKFRQEVPPPTRVLLTEVPYYRGWYRLRLGRWLVGEHDPPLRDRDLEGELRLQVRLLEVRVDTARIGRLEVRVHVDAPVGQILRALQPPSVGVCALGHYPELVLRGQPGQHDPPVCVGGRRVDGRTVQRDLVHRLCY